MKLKLVSFETAKLLKEVGFDLSTGLAQYNEDGELESSCFFEGAKDYLAPTLELVKMWFREVHEIYLEVRRDVCIKPNIRIYHINVRKFLINHDSTILYNKRNNGTYEEALEQGIIEAIKLIK